MSKSAPPKSLRGRLFQVFTMLFAIQFLCGEIWIRPLLKVGVLEAIFINLLFCGLLFAVGVAIFSWIKEYRS